jgi:hypothetical protein
MYHEGRRGVCVRHVFDQENYLRMTPEERRRPDPTFDCPVCFNTVGLSAIVILDCRHRFCQGCLQEHVNVGLGDNRALVTPQ